MFLAAKDLIADQGSDALKMNDIAERAGVSIGSLYQYFPDKRAILLGLAQQYHEESRRCVEGALGEVSDVAALKAAYVDLLDQYHDMFQSEPVMRDIWSGMQCDRDLMLMELAESRACAGILAAAMARAHGRFGAQNFASRAFLIWQLGEATMRLAVSVNQAEGEELVAAFKEMSVRDLVRP